ncbi:MAG: radical SAM protein [Candidatus Aureabacteria bacterium]|nr:radical SAM protein [Candidatus Auribacterota bacterium]
MKSPQTAFPYYVDWAITHKCNLRCVHCRGMKDSELSTDRAVSLLMEIKGLKPGWLIIEGGEPLMRQDFFSLLRYAHELGLNIFIISNGTLLTKSAIGWFASMGIRIMVSIDSPDPATFERVRRGAELSTVTKAASLCAGAGILDAINFTLSRYNLTQIPELFLLARKIGARRINILGLKPCERYTDQLLSPLEYRQAIEESVRASAETGVRFFFDEPFFTVSVREWGVPYSPDPGGSSITIYDAPGCILGKYLFITPDGDVWPCSFAPLVMGNLNGESLTRVWEKMLRSTRLRRLMDHRARNGYCKNCAHVAECGGCRARAFRLTKDWHGPDSACPLYHKTLSVAATQVSATGVDNFPTICV